MSKYEISVLNTSQNLNGRIYSKEILQKIDEQLKSPNSSCRVVQREYNEDDTISPKLEKIIGVVEDSAVDGDELKITVKFLPSWPESKSLAEMNVKDGTSVIRPAGIGSVSPDGKVNEDYQLSYFAMVKKENDSFET